MGPDGWESRYTFLPTAFVERSPSSEDMPGHEGNVTFHLIATAHRPMSRMTSGLTLARRRAVAPAARRQRADTSCGRKPKDGPKWATESRMHVVRSEAVTLVVE